jgi:hypothetical protein
MSDMDNPFIQAQGWILREATSELYYPIGNTLTIGRNQIGTDLYDLVWTEQSGSICYLEAVQYFAGDDERPAVLFSQNAKGYDPDGSEHDYTVSVVLSLDGVTVSAAVQENGLGTKMGDGGSLAGLWGADAKPPGSTTTGQPETLATAGLKAVK